MPAAVCGLVERSTQYFPYEHTVELRPSMGEPVRALVKLDAVKHGNYELLKTFLMREFELGGDQARKLEQLRRVRLLDQRGLHGGSRARQVAAPKAVKRGRKILGRMRHGIAH